VALVHGALVPPYLPPRNRFYRDPLQGHGRYRRYTPASPPKGKSRPQANVGPSVGTIVLGHVAAGGAEDTQAWKGSHALSSD
jgi:hypothetical protein